MYLAFRLLNTRQRGQFRQEHKSVTAQSRQQHLAACAATARMAVDCSPQAVKNLLNDANDISNRSSVAAALSKVAAKAEGARSAC